MKGQEELIALGGQKASSNYIPGYKERKGTNYSFQLLYYITRGAYIKKEGTRTILRTAGEKLRGRIKLHGKIKSNRRIDNKIRAAIRVGAIIFREAFKYMYKRNATINFNDGFTIVPNRSGFTIKYKGVMQGLIAVRTSLFKKALKKQYKSML